MPNIFLKVKNRLRARSPVTAQASPGVQYPRSVPTQSSQTDFTQNRSLSEQSALPLRPTTAQSSSTPSDQNVAPQSDLWEKAKEQLPIDKKEMIQRLLPSSADALKPGLDTTAQIRSLAEKRRDECEARRWKFEFGGKQIILRDVAEKIVIWLDKIKQIGDIVVNYDPVHLALPWAGVRFLLQCAVQDHEQVGATLTGLEHVTRLMSFCEVYEELYIRSSKPSKALEILEKSLVDLYHVILVFFAEVCHHESNLARRVLSTAFSLGRLESLLQKLADLEKLVRHAANGCEAVCNRDHRAKLDDAAERLVRLLQELEDPIRRTDKQVTALLKRVEDTERSEVLCWLSSIPYEDNHRNAKSSRAAGTGQWLLQNNTYRTWRDSSASTILWLHGIPGAGKTKLVTHVVDDLIESLNRQQNDEGFAYFYCHRNDENRQDPLRVMQSFIKQLATPRAKDMLQSSVLKIYADKKRSGFASKELDMKECQDLFYQFTDLYPQTTIVLDALDECSHRTRNGLIKILDESIGRALKPVKVFISSREDDDIKRRFQNGPNVTVSATDNVHDIAIFVAQALAEANEGRSMKMSPAFQEEVVTVLSKRSQGMCQWAALQVNQLLEIDLEDDMRNRLGKLPDDLKQAYDEIYAKIVKPGGRTTSMAIRALLWVMRAKVPLLTSQLVAAVCQDPDQDSVGLVDVDINFVLKICQNLLVVDHELLVCRFAHLSVQEYLETNQLQVMTADLLISKVCLQLFIRGPNPGDCVKKIRIRHQSISMTDAFRDGWTAALYKHEQQIGNGMDVLMAYALCYWPRHIRRCNDTGKHGNLFQLLIKFMQSPHGGSGAYRNWHWGFRGLPFSALTPYHYSFYVGLLDADSRPVLTACYLGLLNVLEWWWAAGMMSVADLNHVPLLPRAASGGHLSICQWLVHRGARIDSVDDTFGSGVAAASKNGEIDVVRYLLGQGADINVKGGRHGSAVRAASAGGHVDVVRSLLARGADLEVGGGEYRPALVAASSKGHIETVQLLLDHGVDVNDRSTELDWTALGAASSRGYIDVVQLLLDRGANVNDDGGGRNKTAIKWATVFSQFDVVALLLRYGARLPTPNVSEESSTDDQLSSETSSQGSVGAVQCSTSSL